ncbi:MAG: hypothetical protein V9G12_16210 [Microthrixaceae bacterium]
MTVTDESATATATDPDAARVDTLIDQLLAENPPESTDDQAFLEAQYDLGLAWVRFPEGYGGIGVSPKLQRTVISRVNRAGGPVGATRNPIGYGMCAPAIVDPRHRRAEANAAAAVQLRAHLVPAVLRARRRLRCGVARDARPNVTATSGSSTARRCGRPWRTSPTTA